MIRAAHATAAAAITLAIMAVVVGVNNDPSTNMAVGHLRAAAIVAAVIAAILYVGARIIREIRAAGAADTLLHTLADRRHGRGD